jgi:hypothetical protein
MYRAKDAGGDRFEWAAAPTAQPVG